VKIFCAAILLLLVAPCCARAADDVALVRAPGFWDFGRQMDRPNLAGLRAIRFLTDDDYPPFNYALPDGSLAGFNVDVARAICEELKVGCTIQARRWDTIVDSLIADKGDAIIASVAITEAAREKLDFTEPYFGAPARFVARKDAKLDIASPASLTGRTVGVVADSAHKAYLDAFFSGVAQKSFADVPTLLEAVRSGGVELGFGDGVAFASQDCCAFASGPFTESRYFGEGAGIAVRKQDGELRRAINWALARLGERGAYSELYLKNFPINPY
jgi:polar amino acid transport system substrate-binding protein